MPYIINDIYSKLHGENKCKDKSKVFDLLKNNLRIGLCGISTGFQGINNEPNESMTFDNLKSNFKDIFKEFNNSVVIFDELDRCKPSYALSILEIVKHFFGIESQISFIFLCDRKQLSYIVKGIYGESYNGNLYLDRFFHHTISLDWDEQAKYEFLEHIFTGDSFNVKFAKDFIICEWLEHQCITCRDILQFNNLYDEIIDYANNGYSAFSCYSLCIARFIILINSRHNTYRYNDLESFIGIIQDKLNLLKNKENTTLQNQMSINNRYDINSMLIEHFYEINDKF